MYLRSGHIPNGVDGLRTLVEQVLRRNPNQGHLFVFVGKRRDKLEILFWDKNGYVIGADA